MGAYDRAIATALRLIEAKGEPVTWRQFIIEPGDNAWTEGEPTPPDPLYIDHTVSMVFLPFSNRLRDAFQMQMANSDVPQGLYYGLMGQVSFTPNLRDLIIRPSGQVRPSYIDELRPAGELILYTIGLQR
jgi:hypothetical protein